jgi:hypothetical protein
MALQITGEIPMTYLTRKQLQELKKQELKERKRRQLRERRNQQLMERTKQQLQERRTKQQLQERFIAEFVRRLREAPEGTRVYMRCGDVFTNGNVYSLDELRAARRAEVVRDVHDEGEEPRR